MYWIVASLLTSLLISNSAEAETAPAIQPLKITVTTKDPYFTEQDDGFLDQLLAEISNRSNIKFEVLKSVPPARALAKLEQGSIDGDFPRVAGLEKIYPSLIHVPEKILDFQFVAFSHTTCAKPISFEAMRNTEVGFVTGWKIYELKTQGFEQLTRVVKAPQLYKLLSRKRIQYALHERNIGNQFITNLKLNEVIQECRPALMTKPMYLYFNKKHQALLPIISSTLQAIKADGTYQRIADATLPR